MTNNDHYRATGNRRRAVLAVAALALVAGMAGCGSSGSGTGSAAHPVTIRIVWWGSDDRAKATNSAVQLFEQRNPTVKVQTEYSAYDAYFQKRSPVALLAPLGLLALGAMEALALLAGLPGGTVLGPPIGLLLIGLTVAGLRAAAGWHPGDSWIGVLRQAAARTVADPAGSVLLALGLFAAGLIAAQVPVFLVVLPGLLVLATVAVEGRT